MKDRPPLTRDGDERESNVRTLRFCDEVVSDGFEDLERQVVDEISRSNEMGEVTFRELDKRQEGRAVEGEELEWDEEVELNRMRESAANLEEWSSIVLNKGGGRKGGREGSGRLPRRRKRAHW